MRRSAASTQTETQQPGAFMPDGSFNPEAGWVHQGPAHQLVKSMCSDASSGRLTAAEAARRAEAADSRAFPNRDQWSTCGPWWAAWTSTSAEEAVKRAGVSHCEK